MHACMVVHAINATCHNVIYFTCRRMNDESGIWIQDEQEVGPCPRTNSFGEAHLLKFSVSEAPAAGSRAGSRELETNRRGMLPLALAPCSSISLLQKMESQNINIERSQIHANHDTEISSSSNKS